MKTSVILVAVGAVVASAQSQSSIPLSSIPQCGQTCINNMIQIATAQGCSAGNVTCFCTLPNFGYGIRDCAQQACGDAASASQAIQYGLTYCNNAVSSASGTPGASAIPVLSAAASGSGNAAGAAGAAGVVGGSSTTTLTSTVSGGAAGNSSAAGGSASPITTSALLATITTDGSTVTTTTGSTTIFGVAGVAVPGSDSSSPAADPGATPSDSSSTPSDSPTPSSTSMSSDAAAATPSSSTPAKGGAIALQTAAPGLFGFAAIAAMLL